jgi:DnaK suppressor protein
MAKVQTAIATVTDYRDILFAKRRELLRSMESLRSDLADSNDRAPDDWAPASNQEFIAHRVSVLGARQLAAIDSALRRMERGGYGHCEACGDEISECRLEAAPWAAYCLACQASSDVCGDARR